MAIPAWLRRRPRTATQEHQDKGENIKDPAGLVGLVSGWRERAKPCSEHLDHLAHGPPVWHRRRGDPSDSVKVRNLQGTGPCVHVKDASVGCLCAGRCSNEVAAMRGASAADKMLVRSTK